MISKSFQDGNDMLKMVSARANKTQEHRQDSLNLRWNFKTATFDVGGFHVLGYCAIQHGEQEEDKIDRSFSRFTSTFRPGVGKNNCK